MNQPRSGETLRARTRELASPGPQPADDSFQLAVESADSGEMVGAIGSHQADARAGWLEYGITISADQRRHGYAAEAVVLLLRFMFAERRFHKYEARIFAQLHSLGRH